MPNHRRLLLLIMAILALRFKIQIKITIETQ